MGITFCRSGHVYELILITKFKSQAKLFDKLSPMQTQTSGGKERKQRKENDNYLNECLIICYKMLFSTNLFHKKFMEVSTWHLFLIAIMDPIDYFSNKQYKNEPLVLLLYTLAVAIREKSL